MILGNRERVTKDFLEIIRNKIAEKPFTYRETDVVVTVTIGAADFEEGLSVTEWLQRADDMLDSTIIRIPCSKDIVTSSAVQLLLQPRGNVFVIDTFSTSYFAPEIERPAQLSDKANKLKE